MYHPFHIILPPISIPISIPISKSVCLTYPVIHPHAMRSRSNPYNPTTTPHRPPFLPYPPYTSLGASPHRPPYTPVHSLPPTHGVVPGHTRRHVQHPSFTPNTLPLHRVSSRRHDRNPYQTPTYQSHGQIRLHEHTHSHRQFDRGESFHQRQQHIQAHGPYRIMDRPQPREPDPFLGRNWTSYNSRELVGIGGGLGQLGLPVSDMAVYVDDRSVQQCGELLLPSVRDVLLRGRCSHDEVSFFL